MAKCRMNGEVETGGEGETQEGLRPCGSSRKTLLGKSSAMALVTLEKEKDCVRADAE